MATYQLPFTGNQVQSEIQQLVNNEFTSVMKSTNPNASSNTNDIATTQWVKSNAGGGKLDFYNNTPAADIIEAYEQGKLLYYLGVFLITAVDTSGRGHIYMTYWQNDPADADSVQVYISFDSTGLTESSYSRVPSLDRGYNVDDEVTSTATNVPYTSAVYNAIQVFSIDSTTPASEIKSAYEQGKVLAYNDNNIVTYFNYDDGSGIAIINFLYQAGGEHEINLVEYWYDESGRIDGYGVDLYAVRQDQVDETVSASASYYRVPATRAVYNAIQPFNIDNTTPASDIWDAVNSGKTLIYNGRVVVNWVQGLSNLFIFDTYLTMWDENQDIIVAEYIFDENGFNNVNTKQIAEHDAKVDKSDYLTNSEIDTIWQNN